MNNACYIAGPMTGIKDFNFPAFFAAEEEVQSMGYYNTFNPARADQYDYGNKLFENETGDASEAKAKGFDLKRALRNDLMWICEHAEAIYMLKGWENSKGARAEHATAVALGLKIIYQ